MIPAALCATLQLMLNEQSRRFQFRIEATIFQLNLLLFISKNKQNDNVM